MFNKSHHPLTLRAAEGQCKARARRPRARLLRAPGKGRQFKLRREPSEAYGPGCFWGVQGLHRGQNRLSDPL